MGQTGTSISKRLESSAARARFPNWATCRTTQTASLECMPEVRPCDLVLAIKLDAVIGHIPGHRRRRSLSVPGMEGANRHPGPRTGRRSMHWTGIPLGNTSKHVIWPPAQSGVYCGLRHASDSLAPDNSTPYSALLSDMPDYCGAPASWVMINVKGEGLIQPWCCATPSASSTP